MHACMHMAPAATTVGVRNMVAVVTNGRRGDKKFGRGVTNCG